MSWLADLIPPPDTRGPLTIHSLFRDLFPPVLCYYATAVLVLIPGTLVVRLAFLPVSLWLTFRGATRVDLVHGSDDERLIYFNQGLLLAFTTLANRLIIWSFQSTPFRRVKTLSEATPEFYNAKIMPLPPKQIFIDALDLSCNLRGCGWNWSRHLQIPPETRPTKSVAAFVRATLASLVLHIVAFDLLHYSMQWFAPSTVGSALGSSIYDLDLPPVLRYLRSSTMSFLAGLTVYSGIQICYLMCSLVGILVFKQHPSLWPPAFDSPWKSTSLTEFWAKRWHQILRDNFISLGGNPLALVAGRFGAVLGSFFISGVLHHFGLWGMGRGADFWSVGGYFLMNGVGIILEHTWRKISGHRVGGWFGWAWTMLWVVGWGNLLVNAWATRGLVGSTFIPQRLRPSTYIFGPLP